MKLWLDDQINDPDCPARKPPVGFIGVCTALQACRLIKKGKVEYISFDHDLGDNVFSGYIVAKYCEKMAYLGKIGRIEGDIHSANPQGKANIQAAMLSADRFWRIHT